MTHSTRFLPDLLRDALHTLEYRRKNSGAPDDPDYLLLSQSNSTPQKPNSKPATPTQSSDAASASPTRKEVLNYLGKLADDYHLPRKLVYAVADAESGFDVDLVHKNVGHDKQGHETVKSVDYGLMEVNSKRINHDRVKDSGGHRMKISDVVERDWKRNAEAGVAILRHNYDLIGLSEPAAATPEDLALATYASYNHGTKHWPKFLAKDKNGLPKDDGVRNFFRKYRQAPER